MNEKNNKNRLDFFDTFPKLKDKGKTIYYHGYNSDGKGFDYEGDVFELKDVKECCLDKQKVKEVITAYLCKYTCKKSEKIKKLRDGILKELKL